MAVRAAIGAAKRQLIAQSFAESTLLGVTGTASGILLAWWGVNALVAAAPVDLPRLNEVHMDLQVLLFALGVSVVSGVAFGVLPALRSALAAPIDANQVDLVFASGLQMKALWDALPSARRGGYAETSAALLPQVLAALKVGDTVLVKGSNGAKMSVIVDALKARAA